MKERCSEVLVSAPRPTRSGQVPRSSQDVLARLENVKATGTPGQYTADCPLPGHKTSQHHLSIRDAGDKVVVCCHGGKHNYFEICRALGFITLSCGYKGRGDKHAVKKPWGVKGITVEKLAEAKRLPKEFLCSQGISNITLKGCPMIRIPYFNQEMEEAGVRFRMALDGPERFRWKKGNKTMLYGLNRLPKDGWLLIVEGESDCWTAWHYGIPAIGVPGKGTWRKEWGDMLRERFRGLYIWQEPEAEDFIAKVADSLPDARYIEAPEGIKDINEAHTQGIDLPQWLEQLKSNARPCGELKDKYQEEQKRAAYQEAKPIIEGDDPLEEMKKVIVGLGFGGDVNPGLIIYLAFTARLLEMRTGAMPPHLILIGDSSSGKNYALSVVKSLFPVEAYYEISASSPRALIYDEKPLQHKALIFSEADSLPMGEDNPAASAMRNLLQEHSLSYDVTIRDKQTGDYEVRHISKPGPTVLITTATRNLGPQLMTRLFTLEISDAPDQISAKLKVQAEMETQGVRALRSDLVPFQKYLQLMAPIRVFVPFAVPLAEAMGKTKHGPRILRDFQRILTLVKSVTVLRHHRRKIDSEGRLIAEPSDYATVRELINDMFVASTSESTQDVRIVVDAVKELNERKVPGEKVTGTMLAKHLRMHKVTVSRRIRKAIRQGWVCNEEEKKGKPADYILGEPMPELEGLPPASFLKDCNTVTAFPSRYIPPQNNGEEQDECNET